MGRYGDPERPPLRESALNRALVGPGTLWSGVEVVAETGSTNTDLARRARAGAHEGTVLVTEHQTAGRGRLERGFHTPRQAALTFSVLLTPTVPSPRYGWLPLLMGVAVVRGIARVAGIEAELKWPNDVLAPDTGANAAASVGKLAGILAEVVPSPDGRRVVIGAGINISQHHAELPPGTAATSLAVAGAACLDRDPLLRAILREFADRYRGWREHDGDADACGLAAEYRARCATIGRAVRVEMPGGQERTGTATGIDPSGRLLVREPDGGETAVSSGDVIHLRLAGTRGTGTV